MVGRRFRNTFCRCTDELSGRATWASVLHLLREIQMTSPAKLQHANRAMMRPQGMRDWILLLAYCWLPASTVSFVLPRHATLEVP